MKRIFLPLVFVVLAALSVFSCKDDESDAVQMTQLKDSIFAAYPTTVACVNMHVAGKTDLNIVLGGAELYKSAAAKKEQMANEIGLMALRIFGKDSYLKNGKLTLTKDERNTSENPADGISANIDLERLKASAK